MRACLESAASLTGIISKLSLFHVLVTSVKGKDFQSPIWLTDCGFYWQRKMPHVYMDGCVYAGVWERVVICAYSWTTVWTLCSACFMFSCFRSWMLCHSGKILNYPRQKNSSPRFGNDYSPVLVLCYRSFLYNKCVRLCVPTCRCVPISLRKLALASACCVVTLLWYDPGSPSEGWVAPRKWLSPPRMQNTAAVSYGSKW